jgi:hypothetical protein
VRDVSILPDSSPRMLFRSAASVSFVIWCRSDAPAYSVPVEETAPPSAHRVQHQSAPRPVSSAVVSDGSVSWASKVKERAAPVQQPVFEPEPANECDDRAYHETSAENRVRLSCLLAQGSHLLVNATALRAGPAKVEYSVFGLHFRINSSHSVRLLRDWKLHLESWVLCRQCTQMGCQVSP